MYNRLFNIGKGHSKRHHDLLWTNEDPTAEFSGMVLDIADIRERYPMLVVVSLDLSYYYQNFEDIVDDGTQGSEDLVIETITPIISNPTLIESTSTTTNAYNYPVITSYHYPQQISGLYEQHLYYRKATVETINGTDYVYDSSVGGYRLTQYEKHNLRISGELYNQAGKAVTTDESQTRYIVPLYIYGIR